MDGWMALVLSNLFGLLDYIFTTLLNCVASSHTGKSRLHNIKSTVQRSAKSGQSTECCSLDP